MQLVVANCIYAHAVNEEVLLYINVNHLVDVEMSCVAVHPPPPTCPGIYLSPSNVKHNVDIHRGGSSYSLTMYNAIYESIEL